MDNTYLESMYAVRVELASSVDILWYSLLFLGLVPVFSFPLGSLPDRGQHTRPERADRINTYLVPVYRAGKKTCALGWIFSLHS